MPIEAIDITPDPRILVALTNTPIRPIDALCELIDNAVDSYRAAALLGQPSSRPNIEITVPGATAVRQGEGAVSIRDYGAGLSADGLANALRAGYSGQNRYDSLGLFGLGFNIAAGKIGRRTVIETAEPGGSQGLRVVYDLMDIVQGGGFKAPIEHLAHDLGGATGTTVTIAEWWPVGHPNANFALRLAEISKPRLRDILGRRYATLLRVKNGDAMKMFVNGTEVIPFEHCVWDESRNVTHDRQQVQARFEFDEKIGQTVRCANDGIVIASGGTACPACGGSDFRTIDERIHGWTGVQRYDSTVDYGIDVIRNGRALLVAQREAFFTYVDDEGETFLEYPIDDNFGRIVGEVHLDHVPVHFTKEDFERTTEEWDRAMLFVRGKALRPGRWDAGYSNTSPVSRLVRAYGRVRKFGRDHLYPGQWDATKQKPTRIPRPVEEDLLARFRAREPGFIDDSKWFQLVEQADQRTLTSDGFECPICSFIDPDELETCPGCTHIVRGKDCVQCGVRLPESALACQSCDAEQLTPVDSDWACNVCETVNDVASETCGHCAAVRGAPNPLDLGHLAETGETVDALSCSGLQVRLSDGSLAAPVDVIVYRVGALPVRWQGERLPLVTDKGVTIRVFLDFDHPVFGGTGLTPMEAVAVEVAAYIYQYHQQLIGTPGHTVGALTTQVVLAMRDDDGASMQLTDRIRDLFSESARLLEGAPLVADYFTELGQQALQQCLMRMTSVVRSTEIDAVRESGRYLAYLDSRDLVGFFEFAPDVWFEHVWNAPLHLPAGTTDEVAGVVTAHRTNGIARCLHDCADFLAFPTDEPHQRARTVAAFEYLDSLRS